MWNTVIKNPFLNCNLIFPTQQKDVATIVSSYSKDDNIQKIIIFGSSVTCLCNPWSDIDLYVEMKEKRRLGAFGSEVEAPLDKWTNFTVDEDLLEKILNTGVVVFDRDLKEALH